MLVEEALLVWDLICELRAQQGDRDEAAVDARAEKQVTKLQKRKSPVKAFLRCVRLRVRVRCLPR